MVMPLGAERYLDGARELAMAVCPCHAKTFSAEGGESGALGGLKGLVPRGLEPLPAEFALSFNPGVGE